MMHEPRDVLRAGPGNIKSDMAIAHPVQLIQLNHGRTKASSQRHMLARVYGSHLPMRLLCEEAVLSQVKRGHGLTSSHAGLEAVLGLDEDVDWCDVLNSSLSSVFISEFLTTTSLLTMQNKRMLNGMTSSEHSCNHDNRPTHSSEI